MTHTMTIREAAAMLGLTIARVRTLCWEGKLPAAKHEGIWALDRSAVEALAAQRKDGTKQGVML